MIKYTKFRDIPRYIRANYQVDYPLSYFEKWLKEEEKESDSDPERYPEGWVLYPEEDVIYMIMHDEAGQSALQEALLEKGISM